MCPPTEVPDSALQKILKEVYDLFHLLQGEAIRSGALLMFNVLVP